MNHPASGAGGINTPNSNALSAAAASASILSSSAPAASPSLNFPPHLTGNSNHPSNPSHSHAASATTTATTSSSLSSSSLGPSIDNLQANNRSSTNLPGTHHHQLHQQQHQTMTYRIQIFPHREGFGNPLSGPLPPAGFNFTPIEMDLSPNVVVRIGRKVDRQKEKSGGNQQSRNNNNGTAVPGGSSSNASSGASGAAGNANVPRPPPAAGSSASPPNGSNGNVVVNPGSSLSSLSSSIANARADVIAGSLSEICVAVQLRAHGALSSGINGMTSIITSWHLDIILPPYRSRVSNPSLPPPPPTSSTSARPPAITGPSGTVISATDVEHIMGVLRTGSEPSVNDHDNVSPYAASATAAAAAAAAAAASSAVASTSNANHQDQSPTLSTPKADFIAFRSKVVSRTHAELWLAEDGQVMFRDVGSSSGTFLNRLRLSPSGRESRPYPIKSGDVIQLGVDYQGRQEEIYKCVQMKVFVSQKSKERPKTNPARLRLALKILLAAMNPNAKDASDASCIDCCICLSTLSPQQALFLAPCSHCFHYRCVMPLLGNNIMFQCPLCRQVANLDANVVEEDGMDYLSSSSEDGEDDAVQGGNHHGGPVVDEEFVRSILPAFDGLSMNAGSAAGAAAGLAGFNGRGDSGPSMHASSAVGAAAGLAGVNGRVQGQDQQGTIAWGNRPGTAVAGGANGADQPRLLTLDEAGMGAGLMSPGMFSAGLGSAGNGGVSPGESPSFISSSINATVGGVAGGAGNGSMPSSTASSPMGRGE
ncbi:hypothetical protein HDU97_000419 [Phlyctochytrium planicorne]|nr:hypothetical protein HDU97_000419 [Phlyctochytrium planicorne]